jgi:hypothetical protein
MNRKILVGLFLLAFAIAGNALSISSYSMDPSPAIPGQTMTLYAYIYNDTSVSVDNVVFSLQLGENTTDTSYPFSIEPTDTLTRELGALKPYQTVQVQYRIGIAPDALDGDYRINLKAARGGIKSEGATKEVTVQILARKPIVSIVSSTPTEVGIGNSTSLGITIRNTGSSPAYDILLSIEEDRTVTSAGTVVERYIVPLGASSVYVDQLGVGESRTINMPILIDPSAVSKPYFLPVSVDYYDSSKTEYTGTDYLGLKVLGKPQLGLLLSEADPLPVPGKPSKITIDMFNTGLGPAKFITAKVNADFISIPTNEFFIGTIESDDFDSIVLDSVVSSSVSPGDRTISVVLDYKNEFGDPETKSYSVPIHVYSASEVPDGNGGFDFTLLLIAVVIAGAVWWFKFRKPKKKS